MEAQLQSNSNIASLHISSKTTANTQNFNLYPYDNIIVNTLSDFDNAILSYGTMLEIARHEIELLLIAKANNPGKINIEKLAPRQIRLAVLNALSKVFR